MNNPLTTDQAAQRDQMRRAIEQERERERRRAELRLDLLNCAYLLRTSADTSHRTRAREAASELLNQLQTLKSDIIS